MRIVLIQSINPLLLLNTPFFRKAPQDDLVTKIAKVAYRALEYLFQLVEMGMDYLMYDPRLKPFHVRYKWSIRIAIIALSSIGIYYGVQHVKERINKYLYSFIPDFDFLKGKGDHKGIFDSLLELFKKAEKEEVIIDENSMKEKVFQSDVEIDLNKPLETSENDLPDKEQANKIEELKVMIEGILQKKDKINTRDAPPVVIDNKPGLNLSLNDVNLMLKRTLDSAFILASEFEGLISELRKEFKQGLYDISYSIMAHFEVEEPEKYLETVSKPISVMAVVVGFYNIPDNIRMPLICYLLVSTFLN